MLQRLLVANDKMYIFTNAEIYKIDLKSPSSASKVPIPNLNEGSQVTNAWLHEKGESLVFEMDRLVYFHLHFSYQQCKVLTKFNKMNIVQLEFFPDTPSDQVLDILMADKDRNLYTSSLKVQSQQKAKNVRDERSPKLICKCDGDICGIVFCVSLMQVRVCTFSEILTWQYSEVTSSNSRRTLSTEYNSISVPIQVKSSRFEFANDHYYYLNQANVVIFLDDPEAKISSPHQVESEQQPVHSKKQGWSVSSHHYFYLNSTNDGLIIRPKVMPERSYELPIPLTPGESLIGITSDFEGQTHWVFTSNSIHEFELQNEADSAWFYYYQNGMFDEALKCIDVSQGNETNLIRRSAVLARRGYELLQLGGFGSIVTNLSAEERQDLLNSQIKGIQDLARLREPLEKISLMLMSQHDEELFPHRHKRLLMIEYLKIKLETAVRNRRKTLIVSYSVLIVKLYSSLLADCYLRESSQTLLEDHLKPYYLEKTFLLFLSKNQENVSQSYTKQILAQYCQEHLLLQYLKIVDDPLTLLELYYEMKSWDELLLNMQRGMEDNPDKILPLVYKFGAAMLVGSPKKTLEFWLNAQGLEYDSLLPTILTCEKFTNHDEKFMQFILHFCHEIVFEKEGRFPNLGTHYLLLLLGNRERCDTAHLLKAISRLRIKMPGSSSPNFDKNVLLRACLEAMNIEAAVVILVQDFLLHDSAVKLALSSDKPCLAEHILSDLDTLTKESSWVHNELPHKEHSDALEHMRAYSIRRLWLAFASYLINGVESFGTPRGMRFEQALHEVINSGNGSLGLKNLAKGLKDGAGVPHRSRSKGSHLDKVLRYLLTTNKTYRSPRLLLKDVLPLLPESANVNHFKNEIATSLSSYDSKIHQLAIEMLQSDLTATKLKAQLLTCDKPFEKSSLLTTIEPGESCRLCHGLLVKTVFVIYPNCNHGFHHNCILKRFSMSKGDYQFKKLLKELKAKNSLENRGALDEFVLKECVLCNDSTINSIDDPLNTPLPSNEAEWA